MNTGRNPTPHPGCEPVRMAAGSLPTCLTPSECAMPLAKGDQEDGKIKSSGKNNLKKSWQESPLSDRNASVLFVITVKFFLKLL